MATSFLKNVHRLVVTLRRYSYIYSARLYSFLRRNAVWSKTYAICRRKHGLHIGTSIVVSYVKSRSTAITSVYYLLIRLLRLMFVTVTDAAAASTSVALLVDRCLGCGRGAKLTLLLSLLESSILSSGLPCAPSPLIASQMFRHQTVEEQGVDYCDQDVE